MLSILRFREWLLELKEAINQQSDDARIDGIALAVHEGHILRQLHDRRGIQLCANYPDGVVKGNKDSFATDDRILLFILEKVPSGQHDAENELTHYARLQRLMMLLRDILLDSSLFCDSNVQAVSDITIEWEYDIYGGWNGLSAGLKLQDYD